MSLQAYLDELRAALRPALCLHSYPSETVERHDKPLVEVADAGSPLRLPPVTVARSPQVRRAWLRSLAACAGAGLPYLTTSRLHYRKTHHHCLITAAAVRRPGRNTR